MFLDQWENSWKCDTRGASGKLVMSSVGDQFKYSVPTKATQGACLSACLTEYQGNNAFICCRINYDWTPARCHVGKAISSTVTNVNHWVADLRSNLYFEFFIMSKRNLQKGIF